MMGKKEFEEKGTTAGLMARKMNALWWTWKVVVMEIGFCVLEVFISMAEKGVFG